MSALTKLSSKGQLTIPKGIQEKLDIAPGTEFYLTVEDGKLLATPKRAPVPTTKRLMDFAGILGTPPNGRSLSLQEIDEAIMDSVVEDEERIQREWREGRK
ncbi:MULTISPECIES: AbrB/MazE/SpoVT family DNA-binding domain-containing protein [unclassified Rhizobium]|jgi:AbrB family looped-hinge helix DNA binding protein|uniref:AbrB/MazE/SpoVT family DNA-binding domain-containing protein n=1 Tax=unclassified Rhizobium TaxID=2613769 RepID=UPI000DD7E1E2|nr:AbrB/MazE/SpoVT family DNA-binding domain-containing protein [Rhizobium sp. UBA1881]